MIMGSYPCCDEPLCIEMPDGGPYYTSESCPACGVTVWHRLSRVDPMSWVEADFLAEYRVDEETKSVELINPPPPETDAEKALRERYAAALDRAMTNHLLYGSTEWPEEAKALAGDYIDHILSTIAEGVARDLFPPSPALFPGLLSRGDEPWRPNTISMSAILGASPTMVIVDEIASAREPVILGIDMGSETGFSIGRARVYLGGELIGETDSLIEPMAGPPFSELGSSMDFDLPCTSPLRSMIERLESNPPEPFHYSQLNPVNRNARRRSPKRKR